MCSPIPIRTSIEILVQTLDIFFNLLSPGSTLKDVRIHATHKLNYAHSNHY